MDWKSGHRSRWRAAAAAVAVFPALLVTTTANVSSVTAAGPAGVSTAWAGSAWLGSAGSATTTGLSDVRAIIGASSGTAATLTGAGVGVALIDTGVAPVAGLPAAQVVNGPDLSFESQSASLRYLDTYGHGTHMAGIIVGNDTATGTKGIAPKAKLTSIKVGTSNGAVDVSQMIAAIDWVVAHKNDDPSHPIRVINLSYGTGGSPPFWTDPVQFAAEKAWKAGIVVVAAAGNSGNNSTRLTNPATDPWLIAVGAASTKGTTTTTDDELAAFTNTDASRPLDILAPGVSIASLRDPGSAIDQQYTAAQVGATLFRGSGTSQAAAVTSAAVALLLQARPTLTPDQVKYNLVDSARWLPNGIAATRGFKMLNLADALVRNSTTVQSHSNSVGTGLLEDARGPSHVVRDNVSLTGEKTVWGPLSTATWASRSAAKTAWSGGVWMGYRVAGDGWTGTSWASRTWAPATWAGGPWGAAPSWNDPDWSGHYWSGHYWSGHYWSGHYWSSDSWSAAFWG